MPIVYKTIYKLNATYKNSNDIFHKSKHTSLKFVKNWKRSWIAEAALRKNNVGGILFFEFKLYHEDILIKTIYYWHKNRNINQWKINIKLRNKPMRIWPINLSQRSQEYNEEILYHKETLTQNGLTTWM